MGIFQNSLGRIEYFQQKISLRQSFPNKKTPVENQLGKDTVCICSL